MEEAEELERVAEWRMRMPDAEAAALLQKLADDVRRLPGSAVFREYTAICSWLGESDGIVDFVDRAHDYRARIGVDHWPADGEAYLRALVDLARQTIG